MTRAELKLNLPDGQQQMLTPSEMNGNTQKRLRYLSFVLLTVTSAVVIVFILAVMDVLPVRNDGKESNTIIENEYFGEIGGEVVERFKLWNRKTGMQLHVLTYGGTVQTLKVPDKYGDALDVVLGYDNLQGYIDDDASIGVLIGRFANRIANGRFEVDGTEFQVSINENGNTLHGGEIGWNKAIWKAEVSDDVLSMTHMSQDGDQGFPGNVKTTATFELTDNCEVLIQFKATTDKPTPINLTTHPYFNLAGEAKGAIYGHNVRIYADRYLPVTRDFIPTGDIFNVEGTIFDLRHSRNIGSVLDEAEFGGYNHNFCLSGAPGTKLAASISEPNSGVEMTVYTDQPGLQFYTSDFLAVNDGKNGHSYAKHAAFCMETQNYPDAPNHANFPDSVLRQNSEYEHKIVYKFGILEN